MSANDNSNLFPKLPKQFADWLVWAIETTGPGHVASERILKFGNTLSDIDIVISDGGWTYLYIQDLVYNILYVESQISRNWLTRSDVEILSTSLNNYVDASLVIIEFLAGVSDSNHREFAFSALSKMNEAALEIGQIASVSESAINEFKKKTAAHARAAKTTTNRRARTKEILRGMGAANFSKSRAQGRLVRDRVRAQLEIDDPDDDYPKEDTLKDLICEIVAEGQGGE
jgi:hypothetical protein